jgi:hypothetical protein
LLLEADGSVVQIKVPNQTIMALALLAAIATAPSVHAQEGEGQTVSQQGVVELTLDHAESGQDVLAVTIEYGLAVRFAEGWTFNMDAVLEPVVDPVGDEALEGEDAFIETMSLQYAADNFTVYGGKINPVFGSAADFAPGLYGVEAGESYQITEALGVGGDISLTSLLKLDGEHVLSAAAFTADRSVLSGSLGGIREELELVDGGLANTKGLQSVALSLDGVLTNGLGYTVGHRRLATESPGETDEDTTVVGLNYVWPEDSGVDLSLMAEVAASRNADGVDGANRHFYTAGGTLGLGNWGLGDWFVNAIASGWNEDATAGNVDVRKLELSVGRALVESLVLEVGVQDVRESGVSEAVFGARLAWEFG